jgi:predicted SnoaL-like aldol condensation-catalyzing enzyme
MPGKTEKREEGMDTEANKAVVRRYMEMWNTGNVALADELLAPTYVDHAHPEVTGPESVKQAVLRFRAAFPDFHISLGDMVSEGDLVALRATLRRTQQGKEVVSRVTWFVRFAGGMMAELWTGSETSS